MSDGRHERLTDTVLRPDQLDRTLDTRRLPDDPLEERQPSFLKGENGPILGDTRA